ncbi:nitroreductase family protein [Agromyces seonyuensis]|uniref:Nitroreductase n=1 Tax=Agromyces seonyuensis TaxID=2662446 RepID=A0A6I4P0F7_9MICO|nr:nitroreductase family protein [Agromyces seonyuensis]MWC00061.1 nitroreductase [Agromyces seonyuensis]
MTIAEPATRTADTSIPVLDVLAERWSPRSYDAEAEVPAESIRRFLEAARWAPSANNSQPSRFIVGVRGTETFDRIHDALLGFNQAWADRAGVLVVNVIETVGADGRERPFATYDLGQAVAHLSVQAHADGLHAHQMGGIDREKLREVFGLGEHLVPFSVTAVGVVGSPDQLDETLRARETAPRTRLTLEEIVLPAA